MTALLKVKAVKAGLVAIRGHETGLFLAMDKCGRLYGTVRSLVVMININDKYVVIPTN